MLTENDRIGEQAGQIASVAIDVEEILTISNLVRPQWSTTQPGSTTSDTNRTKRSTQVCFTTSGPIPPKSPPEFDLEIIVPAFNEQSRIGSTLESLVHQVSEMQVTSRLRVIDNGSTDRTPDIVDRVRRSYPKAGISLEGCSRQGKGGAVARGMLTSTARWVGFCDADLATPPSAIIDAVGYLEDGWPVVIGSRHMLGSNRVVDQALTRRIGGAGFRLLSRRLAGDLALSDTQCGFKFFDRSAAHAIFSKTRSVGFAFDVEVLTQARVLGYTVKEFPVEWTDREGSTFHVVRHGADVTRDLWRLRRRQQRLARTGR